MIKIEADRFSYELTGDSQSMISALVKLSKDNLCNSSATSDWMNRINPVR
ncbi:MAG TPA: hypothetical protein ACFYEH_06185 [Candidatus Brocadiaceae bacterium]